MTKKEYRTREQIDSIFDSAYNGNWTQAYDECVEYGVYAVDLIKHLDKDNYVIYQDKKYYYAEYSPIDTDGLDLLSDLSELEHIEESYDFD